jgi:hypothetical protein
MAASITDVCNSALAKLGVYPLIASISENSKPAYLCNARYQYVVDEVLRSHPWNFAKKRAALGLSVTVPNYYFTQQFPLPSDFSKLLRVDFGNTTGANSTNDEWVLESGNLLCFSTAVNILYIFKNYDTTTWDQLFEEAIAWRLATDICYALTQSASLMKNCADGYKETLLLARSMNAQDRGSVEQIEADDWENVRGGQWQDPSRF